MELHRLIADAEPRSDGLVRQSLRQQLQHFDLARRQRFLEVSARLRRLLRDDDRVGLERRRARIRQRRELADDVDYYVGLRPKPRLGRSRGPSAPLRSLAGAPCAPRHLASALCTMH